MMHLLTVYWTEAMVGYCGAAEEKKLKPERLVPSA